MDKPDMEKPEDTRSKDIRHAKIQASLKLVEWSRDDIEPGIGGNPSEKHRALSIAFQQTYKMISEVVDGDTAEAPEK